MLFFDKDRRGPAFMTVNILEEIGTNVRVTAQWIQNSYRQYSQADERCTMS